MAAAGVPTAASRAFTSLQAALGYIAGHAEPLVVKARGGAGKGAVVCDTGADASAAARDMLAEGRLGEAGHEIVIERFLGVKARSSPHGGAGSILPPAQDHKRLGSDTGPNTAGGCAPSRWPPHPARPRAPGSARANAGRDAPARHPYRGLYAG
jgi:phosphoribosylamine--glycine ligase